MSHRHRGSRRKLAAGLLAGVALVALSGCYPYYYDFHYRRRGHRRGRGSYRSRRYYGRRRHHHHDRDRRKRYRHYRGHW